MQRPFIAVLVNFCAALSCFAWGGDGHQVVNLIAEKQLTPAAKQMIHELLDGAEISDGEIASWADEIRREREDTGSWHYVNIPVSEMGYNEARDGRDGQNVVAKIADFANILNDRQRSKAERAEALKFLVHFVGDVHQPLHCADRNDGGGNGRLVFFLSQPKAESLHRVWDSLILQNDKGQERVADYADRILNDVSKADAAKWALGNPADWANESHAAAVKTVYLDIPAGGNPPRLDSAYVDRGILLTRQQLCKAGLRLAKLLNRIAAR